nr:hypothetical protein [Sphingomonas sp. CDS-1]
MTNEEGAKVAHNLYRRGNGHTARAKLLHGSIFMETEKAGVPETD